jgi:hypothetical protein
MPVIQRLCFRSRLMPFVPGIFPVTRHEFQVPTDEKKESEITGTVDRIPRRFGTDRLDRFGGGRCGEKQNLHSSH